MLFNLLSQYLNISTEWVAVAITVLDLYLRGAYSESLPGLINPTEVFHRFPQSLQTNARIIPPSGHNNFLPNPVQFIIHLPSYHSMPLASYNQDAA
jgi:hypothetical protein